MLELSNLKKEIDDLDLFERSWIEQNELFASGEEENGDVLLIVKRIEYSYLVKIFWKSPFSNDQSGMVCMSHNQLKHISIQDVLNIISNARKTIENQISSSIKSLKI